jgi:carboxyl-terminal processing protease
MPRRNLVVLVTVTLVALLCYQRVQKNPYGRVLANAMTTIENRYIEPVEASKLFERAMDGIVDKLDDNSAYISPADLKEFRQSIDLQFEGVGMEVAMDPETKQLMVLSPLAGCPAYKAGIRAGDKILRIGADSTRGMSLHDAVALLRGKPGEPVTLTVLHEGEQKPVEITIVRGKIQVDSVRGDTRNADGSWNFFLAGHRRIGYIRIESFTDKTADELEQALKWLSAHDMSGLVLDLRDDPGGYVTAAVDVCDQLISSGVIVTVRRRGGEISRTYAASGQGQFTDFPIAVLINEKTASAAEIVAACLQDHHRAMIFGGRSYGKGTVQEVIDLEKGCGAMKITTANYWRPNGKNIHRSPDASAKADWGVSPDEGGRMPLSGEEQSRWRVWRARRDASQLPANTATPQDHAEPFVDRPLVRAVEYLEKEAAGKQSAVTSGQWTVGSKQSAVPR